MAGSHVVVARYDMLALKDLLDSGCIFISDESKECELDASPSPGPTVTPSPDPSALPTETPEPEGTPDRQRPARGHGPAVGRQGAAQHPAHRRRPAPERAAPSTPTR